MSVRTKKLLSVLSVVFSLAAVGIGSGLITHDYSAAVRFLMKLVFQGQFLLSLWVAVIVFRDNKK